MNFIKLKRGYYRYDPIIITENAKGMLEGELTLLYRDFLENCIKAQPDNYLWSHRRWKYGWDPQYTNNWIDGKPPVN